MASKPLSPTVLTIIILIIVMIVLFLFIAGFLIYRYHTNQRRYLKTLTRSLYDTLQRSSYDNPVISPYLQINPSIGQGLERTAASDSHYSQYAVSHVYK
ncbi:unnamed protein product [Adineta steineri]|uniref:Uncharacterized protein n=1 Tax=Adineta steineri TaxID=433720 RepID=A0A814GWT3_9BILA|nr:unnamed protein product [Adineta steineri]